MSDLHDQLFDRYDALTFDDVVVIPGYSETLPDAVDTSAVFAADIVEGGPYALGFLSGASGLGALGGALYLASRVVVVSDLLGDEPGLVYETHSTDYQTPAALRELVEDGFAIFADDLIDADWWLGVEIAPAAKGRTPNERAAFLGRLHSHQAVPQMTTIVGNAADRAGQGFARQVAEACLRHRCILHQHRFVKRHGHIGTNVMAVLSEGLRPLKAHGHQRIRATARDGQQQERPHRGLGLLARADDEAVALIRRWIAEGAGAKTISHTPWEGKR